MLRPADPQTVLSVAKAWLAFAESGVNLLGPYGNFGSEADVRSLYFRGFRFNETSDNGACTHGEPAK